MCWAVGPLSGVPWRWTCCRFCAGFAQGTFVKTDSAGLELRESPGQVAAFLPGPPTTHGADRGWATRGSEEGKELLQNFISPLSSPFFLPVNSFSLPPYKSPQWLQNLELKPRREVALHHQSPLRPASRAVARVGKEGTQGEQATVAPVLANASTQWQHHQRISQLIILSLFSKCN